MKETMTQHFRPLSILLTREAHAISKIMLTFVAVF